MRWYIWKRHVRNTFICLLKLPYYFWRCFVIRKQIVILTLKSLFYNEFLSANYFLECLLEPMFWVVDHFSKALGPILVAGVVGFTSSVVFIVYMIGLPYYWDKYPYATCFLIILGHWLLTNIVFHFYMAASIDPGTCPKGILICEAVSICKKCISPKPPRTHHCSVCNRCVLKMDHHCPWLNNCVGHFNQRHFFMYMVFMVAGTLFVFALGFEIGYDELWLGGKSGIGFKEVFEKYFYTENFEEPNQIKQFNGYPVRKNGTHLFPVLHGTTGSPILMEPPTEVPPLETGHYLKRFAIMYTAMLSLGAFISLGFLSIWHGRLISRGETSIEAHINKKETERLAKIDQVYRNPYNYGTMQNWKFFLGLSPERGILSIILPSSHHPIGSGLTWPNSLISAAAHDKAA